MATSPRRRTTPSNFVVRDAPIGQHPRMDDADSERDNSAILPPLRPELELLPSPDAKRPGFLLRDPLLFTDAMFLLPPILASGLPFFDGEHSLLDLKTHFVRLTGQILPPGILEGMVAALRDVGFLLTEEFEVIRADAMEGFRAALVRDAAHAGAAYPEDETELRALLDVRLSRGSSLILPSGFDDGPFDADIIGVAAPHVSPEGGWASYASAYSGLGPKHARRTVIILGTSHYGEPERFGLTRKPFMTPYGEVPVATEIVEELVRDGGEAVSLEDYCHAIEHSIEFQCVMLRHRLGPALRIVPILCGSFWQSLRDGVPPESHPNVARFVDALRGLQARRGSELLWILGIDLAHVGSRYGDSTPARAEMGGLLEVRARDLDRLERACVGDTGGLLDRVLPRHDDLRWCGFSPLYTFLQVVPGARGEVWRYEQWNIDPESVVSFAAVGFKRGASPASI